MPKRGRLPQPRAAGESRAAQLPLPPLFRVRSLRSAVAGYNYFRRRFCGYTDPRKNDLGAPLHGAAA